jgi:hypothetical protein
MRTRVQSRLGVEQPDAREFVRTEMDDAAIAQDLLDTGELDSGFQGVVIVLHASS